MRATQLLKPALISLLILLLAGFAASVRADAFSVLPSLYKIEIQSSYQVHQGTGLLIAPDKILSSCHVLRHLGVLRVIHYQSGQVSHPYTYNSLGNFDACIIRGSGYQGQPVSISESFAVGQAVWQFGFPGGLMEFTQGKILGMVKTVQGVTIESANICKPGASGGPLVDDEGQLVGLSFASRTSSGRMSCLSIPANLLRSAVVR